MPRKKPPELMFQPHISELLVREHRYGAVRAAVADGRRVPKCPKNSCGQRK